MRLGKPALLQKEGVMGSQRDNLSAAIPRSNFQHVICSALQVASFSSRYYFAQRLVVSALQPQLLRFGGDDARARRGGGSHHNLPLGSDL